MKPAKKCSRCRVEQRLEHFNKNSSTYDGVHAQCKQCTAEFNARKRFDNPEAAKAKRKMTYAKYKDQEAPAKREWGIRNRALLTARTRAKRENDRQAFRDYMNNYNKTRRETDFAYREECRLRSALRHALAHLVTSPTVESVCGCSLDELKAHFEQQFKPGWTWENYPAAWEIDHIKPCCTFDLADLEQQKLCFHFTNLRPLEPIRNKQKGSKYDPSIATH